MDVVDRDAVLLVQLAQKAAFHFLPLLLLSLVQQALHVLAADDRLALERALQIAIRVLDQLSEVAVDHTETLVQIPDSQLVVFRPGDHLEREMRWLLAIRRQVADVQVLVVLQLQVVVELRELLSQIVVLRFVVVGLVQVLQLRAIRSEMEVDHQILRRDERVDRLVQVVRVPQPERVVQVLLDLTGDQTVGQRRVLRSPDRSVVGVYVGLGLVLDHLQIPELHRVVLTAGGQFVAFARVPVEAVDLLQMRSDVLHRIVSFL